MTEKIILQIPDETLGGDILNEEEDVGDGTTEGKGANVPVPDIKFPIHEYSSSKGGVNFTLTPDIPVAPHIPRKTSPIQRMMSGI